MAQIKEFNMNENSYNVTLNIKKQEIKHLNLFDNYYLVNSNVYDYKSNIVKRGKNDSTKYIRIPKELKTYIDDKFENCKISIVNGNNLLITFEK